jgi:hypothetical protein
MAADAEVLRDLAQQAIEAPDFFERARINPVIALQAGQDRNYTLIAHLWLPLDDGRTDLTHQSVHHHGPLLLSSVSAWGGGYESVLFKGGFEVTGEDGATDMKIDKIYRNPRGHLEFVETDTPHVVFFPSDFTVTYALWSRERPQAASAFKLLPGVRAYKKTIKGALERLGLASRLGLAKVENYDFYPRAGRLYQMRERVMYSPGSRENFLENFFWCLREMRFDRSGVLASRIRRHGGHPAAERLLRQLETGEPLARRMERIHLGVDKVQFTKDELLGCFPAHKTG